MGFEIQGYTIETQRTLQGIGKAIYLYDYRYGVSLISSRVYKWLDRSINTLHLVQTTAARRFFPYADGIGNYNGVSGTCYMLGPTKDPLKPLYNGAAFMHFSVLKYMALDGARLQMPVTTEGTNNGIRSQILESNGFYRTQMFNTGGGITTVTGPAVTFDEFILLASFSYGNGANGGVNNLKVVVRNVVTAGNFNTSLHQGLAQTFQFGGPSGLGKYIFKCMGAYDLTGYSIAQVDAFMTLFYTTLKYDPEYSSIVTP